MSIAHLLLPTETKFPTIQFFKLVFYLRHKFMIMILSAHTYTQTNLSILLSLSRLKSQIAYETRL